MRSLTWPSCGESLQFQPRNLSRWLVERNFPAKTSIKTTWGFRLPALQLRHALNAERWRKQHHQIAILCAPWNWCLSFSPHRGSASESTYSASILVGSGANYAHASHQREDVFHSNSPPPVFILDATCYRTRQVRT